MVIDKIFEKAAGDRHAWLHCTLGNKYSHQFLIIKKTLLTKWSQVFLLRQIWIIKNYVIYSVKEFFCFVSLQTFFKQSAILTFLYCFVFSLYRLKAGTLFHIFTMLAIKWHIRFVDCLLIYTDFQKLFVFKMFEFGANFGPRWFSLGFEFVSSFKTYGKICKKMSNPTKNQLAYFGWVGEIMSWSEN